MTKEEIILWEKIQKFEFDKPDIQLTFAKRLARENNLSLEFSKMIVEEYKKFIFLCCVSTNQVTPSHFVDLAWHLHLTYTKSYWNELCQNTIQKQIHHHPTEGGKNEGVKFRDYYNSTLSLYEKYFEVKPPSSIWQASEERFKMNILNVDKNENWIIPKPKLGRSGVLPVILILLTSTLLIACDEGQIVVLTLFGFGAVMVFGIYSAISTRKDRKVNNPDSTGCSTIDTMPHGGSHSHHNDDSNDGDSSGDSDGGGGDGGCSGCGGGGD